MKQIPDWDLHEICPTCGEKTDFSCKCIHADKVCDNGHHWFICREHGKTVIGQCDHGKFGCQCNATAVYRTANSNQQVKKTVDQVLIYSPKADITAQELSEILRLVVFHSYPPELKTQEALTSLFNQLPTGAQRHFQLKDPQ